MALVGLSLLVKYAANISSNKSKTITSPVGTFNLPKYEKIRNCYESACQEDPDLKSFDSLLNERTSKLSSSIEGKTGEKSFLDTLNEQCTYQVDVCQNVFKTIIDNKEEISKNKEIKSLVDLYFECTDKTLNFFNTVEKCVEKADIIQLRIRVAIKEFETASMDRKYARTLEKLNKVKAMEDPFGEEFETQYESILKEQVMLLDKILEMLDIIEKKHKNAKKWRIVGYALFAAALSSVTALSVWFIVVTVPVLVPILTPVVAHVAAEVAAHVAVEVAAHLVTEVAVEGAAHVVAEVGVHATAHVVAHVAVVEPGIRLNQKLRDNEKSVKKDKESLKKTATGTKVNIEAMKTIKSLVESLITKISSILETVEVAEEMSEVESMNIVMQQIIEKVEVFQKQIKEVGTTVAKCSKSVVSGRINVLEHISSSPSLKRK